MNQSRLSTSTGRRNVRSKRRQNLILRLFVLVVIIAILLLASTLFFRVDGVIVEGAEHHTAQEIQDVSGIRQGRQLFTLPQNRIRRQLLDRFPYLRDVNIRLRLPDTVVITLDERQPIAYIEQYNQRWILDFDGRLLEATHADTTGFAIRGISLNEPQVNTYFSSPDVVEKQTYELLLSAFYRHELLDTLDYVDLTALADITFGLDGRFAVRLGVISDLDYKFRLLSEMLAQLEIDRPNARGTITLADSAELRRAVFSEDVE